VEGNPVIERRNCGGCGEPLPLPFLDLGCTPLANSYGDMDEPDVAEFRAPLAVAFCEACCLVQLTHVVPPEHLFRSYAYFSSYSSSYLRHAEEMARSLVGRYHLGSRHLVLEIASNDGYLLQYFQQLGVPVLGIDPAANVAAEARKKGIPTWTRFFDRALLPELERKAGKADLIIGNNVLAHVPGINGFLGAVRDALRDDGHAVFEFPYLGDLLDKGEFDTIYHEHVYYFSLSAVGNLAQRAGLQLLDVSRQDVHGGSLRVVLGRKAYVPPSSAVTAMLQQERISGLRSASRFRDFSKVVSRQRADFVALIEGLRRSSYRVAAYGAPAKGNTLLNTCGIDRNSIEFTVDRSPHKQGLRLPGSGIPIFSPESLLQRQPDYAIILPWNLAGEIVLQEAEYLRRGGRFIVPIPSPKIISAASA
jgi:SAM-dependent methyltransferase